MFINDVGCFRNGTSTTPPSPSQEGSFHRRGCWGPDDVSIFCTEGWLFTVDDNDDSDDAIGKLLASFYLHCQ